MIWLSALPLARLPGSSVVSQMRFQDLDRYSTVVLLVEREVDRRHAAGTELALDAVAAREGRVEAVGLGTHRAKYAACNGVALPPFLQRLPEHIHLRSYTEPGLA